ncbi:hypothetical protein O3P69_018487 [Scylla paramamosain]|uniref:Selenoprotein F/M domain-containing protein n=1 Tax=Scylla paramamosain TaxID=85552 RepID=A0AAW0T275_SCYPA
MARGLTAVLILAAACVTLGQGVRDKGVARARLEHVQGATPELVLLNKYTEELQRIDLRKMSQEEINQLVTKKGFYRKATKEEEVPQEYRTGPYVEKDEL